MSSIPDIPVLVVDDDAQLTRTLADILRLRGFRPHTVGDAAGALRIAQELSSDLAVALVDLRLPDMDGIEVASRLHALSRLTEVVVLTGHASMDSALRALREESFDYLVKPVDPDRLLETLGRASDRWRRRVMELRLRQTEERFRVVVENMSDMIFLLDDEGRVRYASPSASRRLARPARQLEGAAFTGLLPDDEVFQLGPVLKELRAGQGGPVSLEHSLVGSEGEIQVESTAERVDMPEAGILITSRDVGERRRLEAELYQSRRMESVGRLAGGIAHDFNNLLTVVSGAVELCRLDAGPDFPHAHYLGEIRDATQRGSTLVRQLLAFSRRQILEPRVLDPNDLIRGARTLIRRMLGEDIDLRVDLGEGVGNVMADPGQLEQVLMNLAANARDAMPRGGALTIRTRSLEAPVGEGEPADRPERAVRIEVSDEGEGMPPEVRERIFEPFFTTKPVGRGTGLGLATVLGIIQQSDGHIEVESEAGVGTTFMIDLPVVEGDPERGAAEEAEARTLTGTETILVVEDDEAVRGVMGRVLRGNGYQVLEAATGAEALAILGRPQQTVDLLFSDVVLPGMTGPDLVELAREIRPGLSAVLSSGYSEDAIARRGQLAEGVGLLPKPFRPAQLLRFVRSALDG